MKIVAAPNAFKESLTAMQAAAAIKQGVAAACPECEVIMAPVSDGGDGLTEVLVEVLKGKIYEQIVKGPSHKPQLSSFGYIEKTGLAIIEMAKASGLALLQEEERDPTETSTYGTGQLILAALNKGASRIIVGLGGSATCDGGTGMASALGFKFLDKDGFEIAPSGRSLSQICSIDTRNADSRIAHVIVEGVCDVTNPLTGPHGASYVYSPQKGASDAQVRLLDDGLKNLAEVIKRSFGVDIADKPGAGAAGGLGAGLSCFLGAKLRKGIDLVMDLVELHAKIQGANLIVTGEGQIDYQTKFDKAPAGVARIAKASGIPCIAVCGSIGPGIQELHDTGISAVFSLCDGPQTLDSAMTNSFNLLANAVEQVIRTFISAQKTTPG